MIKLKPKQEIIDLLTTIRPDTEENELLCEEIGETEHPSMFFEGTYEHGTYKHIETGKVYKNHEMSTAGLDSDSEKYKEKSDIWSKVDYVPSDDDREHRRVQLVEDSNDGDGRECRRIFYIPDYDLYVKAVGTYSSWTAASWYLFKLVKPKEVTVTVYEDL
jgi:hypothetical protein